MKTITDDGVARCRHRAELWAALAGGLHFRVSAKANTNVPEVLGTLASLLSTGQRRPLLSKSFQARPEPHCRPPSAVLRKCITNE